MNPGDLKHPILIQTYQSGGETDGGFPLPAKWVTMMRPWAEKNMAGSDEYYAAAAVQQENNVSWTIRYRQGVKPDMQVLETRTGKTYEIIGDPQDEEGLRKELVLMTKEVKRDAG